jgi:capsid portal protein
LTGLSAAEGRSAVTERIVESTEAQVFKPNVLQKKINTLIVDWILSAHIV